MKFITVILFVFLFLAEMAGLQAGPLLTATGVVKKATPHVVIVTLQGRENQSDPSIALKIRGTSNLTLATVQTRAGEKVVVQREIDAKNIQTNQPIAVIYMLVDGEAILLSAVTQPLGTK